VKIAFEFDDAHKSGGKGNICTMEGALLLMLFCTVIMVYVSR